jgi:hypothetical protein
VALVLWVIGILWLNFYDIHVRYRLTVEVQDGDQIKTGSSVIDASYEMQPDWSPSGPHTGLGSFTGYSPTVDLGKKGMLFLTFESMPSTPDHIRERNKQFFCANVDVWCLPFAAYGEPGTGVATGVGPAFSKEKAALNDLLRKSGPRVVPFVVLPRLGRFLDISDPLTLVPVSPYDLAASFGPGVELKRVLFELTRDPVTPPPDIWPQWLKEKGQMRGKLRGYPND